MTKRPGTREPGPDGVGGTSPTRLFVLDTNVLMHDPAAIFRFDEHDIFLPMAVLEELDAAKKGVSEVARNARQASRFLDELVDDLDRDAIESGIRLPARTDDAPGGRLFFQTKAARGSLPDTLPGKTSDNDILAVVSALVESRGNAAVLVSKDINLRIKARVLGIPAEDYFDDRALEDIDVLYGGTAAYPPGFWTGDARLTRTWQDDGQTLYRIGGASEHQWHPNQCLYDPEAPQFDAVVEAIDDDEATLRTVRDFTNPRHRVWGINARNREQNFALNLLMEPEVDFVTLLGSAGTGKTLLTLAAGLAQTMETKTYREIVMTRVTVPVGDDIGFLPGTEEEKMTPWMGALMDNLEVLVDSDEGGGWGRSATQDLLHSRIKLRSLNFMRGRTFLGRFVIIDEAQNLTRKQMRTLITRAGPGTKLVCLGNVAQIDTPYLTETTSGLTYVVDRFKNWPHAGHITLLRGERSRLADFASEAL